MMVLSVSKGLASLLVKEIRKLCHSFLRNTDTTDGKESITIKRLPSDPSEREDNPSLSLRRSLCINSMKAVERQARSQRHEKQQIRHFREPCTMDKLIMQTNCLKKVKVKIGLENT